MLRSVLSEHTVKRRVDHDHGIETVTPDRADDALHVGIGQSRQLQSMRVVRGESSASPIRFTH
jgi:hypothetical protein